LALTEKARKDIDMHAAFVAILSAVGKGIDAYADAHTSRTICPAKVPCTARPGNCSAHAAQSSIPWRGFTSRPNNSSRVTTGHRYRRAACEGMEAEAQYTCLNTWTALRRVQGIPHPAIEGSVGLTTIARGGIEAKRQATPQLRTPIARRPLAQARGRSLLTPGPALPTPKKTQGAT
jgi:hypothetical protein